MIVMILVTPKAAAKHELLFNKPASGLQSIVSYGAFTRANCCLKNAKTPATAWEQVEQRAQWYFIKQSSQGSLTDGESSVQLTSTY
jgi:hypothetical protein